MSIHTQRHWLSIGLLVAIGSLVAMAVTLSSHATAADNAHVLAQTPSAALPAGDNSVPAASAVFGIAGVASAETSEPSSGF